MSGSSSRTARVVGVVAVVYFVAGVVLPNPSTPGTPQFLWRLAAWVISAIAFAWHIVVEHFRFRSPPRSAALHAALSVVLGVLAIAATANMRAVMTDTGNPRLLRPALVVWPVATGVLAFVAALVGAAVLSRVDRRQRP